tara:strand:- start:1151 stop:1618 length:468 start_codon:yes stop_codon:yes gene_type:complete
MIKINKSNYEYYKGIYKIICELQGKYSQIEPNTDYSPINILINWEKKNESLARKGLSEGLRDSLTGIKYLPKELQAELNNNLIAKKFPSINILTSRIRNLPYKVLEKGKIKNIDEYYVIKEVLLDIEYEITKMQRNELNRIFLSFEQNYKEKNDS